MRAGIVGNGTDKFTEAGEREARLIIVDIVREADVVISGHSPVGGVDIWAEEEAEAQGVPTDLKIPKQQRWDAEYGYKQRNLDIAHDSDVVHVILADEYPEGYSGRRFTMCYHCKTDDHVKSGACWTAKQAIKAGKEVRWYVVTNDPR